jgi:hypothetical protein
VPNRLAFGRFFARVYADLDARDRIDEIKGLKPLLDAAWPKAVRRLHMDLIKVAANIPDEILKVQVENFALSLSYHIDDKEIGRVCILSSNRYLERALYYGSRQIPAIRPLQLFAGYLEESEALDSIVFTAREFIDHETRDPAPNHP